MLSGISPLTTTTTLTLNLQSVFKYVELFIVGSSDIGSKINAGDSDLVRAATRDL